MKQSKQRITEQLEAIIAGSGLLPDWENDFYNESTAANRANLIQGIINHFNVPDGCGLFRWNNLGWTDSPSETIERIVNFIYDFHND